MNSSLLPVALILCASAGAALWWWPTASEDANPTVAPTPSAQSTSPAESEVPVLNAAWKAPAEVQNPNREEMRRMIKLPSGAYVKALNGAVDARPLDWPADRPYSPIIRVERASDGKEWWVHADGSKSTTEMVYRSDLGRHDAVTQVANPAPTMGMAPEDLQRAGRQTGQKTGSPPGGGDSGAGSSANEIKKQ